MCVFADITVNALLATKPTTSLATKTSITSFTKVVLNYKDVTITLTPRTVLANNETLLWRGKKRWSWTSGGLTAQLEKTVKGRRTVRLTFDSSTIKVRITRKLEEASKSHRIDHLCVNMEDTERLSERAHGIIGEIYSRYIY